MKPKSKIASFFYSLFVNHRELGPVGKIGKVVNKMNLSEKIFLAFFSFIFALSGLVLLWQLNESFLVEIPAFGGSFTEGLIGSPRFINPVLAISETDKDMTTLIYSGLLKIGEDGKLVADLAESFQMSEDGLVYDFKIKENAYFHDGRKLTADDIIFTIEKVLDPIIKSPKQSIWAGVNTEKISELEVRFTLKKPYAPFLNALTLGILPKHIWENVSAEEFPFSEFNINPVGSGPYKVAKIVRNSGGIPTTISLTAWLKYTLERPKIKTITFKFFQNENALIKAYEDQEVESAAGLSQTAASSLVSKNEVSKTALPRVFGVFFNQNVAPVFLNQEIREALNLATPKQKIIDEVLLGFGQILNGPTPANVETDQNKIWGDVEVAKALLAKAGWKANADGILEKKTKTGTTLFQFSLSTSDAPELKKTAEILQTAWQNLGASVSVKVFESADLSQNIIKSRKYDALLFGEVVGADSDLFPFWHSSERNDPGLNISLYANISVDKALENLQKETDETKKLTEKEIVYAEIKKDQPAIFLFSPQFLYLPAKSVKNISLRGVAAQNERFFSINHWFIETDRVWKIFAKNN